MDNIISFTIEITDPNNYVKFGSTINEMKKIYDIEVYDIPEVKIYCKSEEEKQIIINKFNELFYK